MPKKQWIWQCDRTIPSDAGLGRRVLDELLTQMKARQWSERDIYSVRLAMEEALVNAIMHGNQLNQGKRVRIHCRLAEDLVRIEVGDEGVGFDPSILPDPTDGEHIECPCGRGVMLMRAFMSEVVYNATGNHVRMEKLRDHGA